VIFGKFGYPINDLEACQDLLFIVYTAYVTALDLSWSSRSQTLSSIEWSGFKSKSSPVQSNEITGGSPINVCTFPTRIYAATNPLRWAWNDKGVKDKRCANMVRKRLEIKQTSS